MEENRTNKTVLVEGLKKMGISLVFMFLGPTVLYIAFSNKERPLYIPILIFGILISTAAVYFAFTGLKTIMDSMFNNEKQN